MQKVFELLMFLSHDEHHHHHGSLPLKYLAASKDEAKFSIEDEA